MPQERGTPFLSSRRTIGTIPQSQTGKITPSRPLTNVGRNRFFGIRPVIPPAGTNAPITPDTSEPSRINGTPSKTSARKQNQKFCQLNANQFIKGDRTFHFFALLLSSFQKKEFKESRIQEF